MIWTMKYYQELSSCDVRKRPKLVGSFLGNDVRFETNEIRIEKNK